MKKLSFVICAILCLSLSSCERSIYAMEQDAKREAAYNEGYDFGYEEGRIEGFSDAQFWLEEDLNDISSDIETKYGISPDEAIEMLTLYADGEYVPRDELRKASLAVSQFYLKSQNAIRDTEDNWYK